MRCLGSYLDGAGTGGAFLDIPDIGGACLKDRRLLEYGLVETGTHEELLDRFMRGAANDGYRPPTSMIFAVVKWFIASAFG